jgi:hypothetical protein
MAASPHQYQWRGVVMPSVDFFWNASGHWSSLRDDFQPTKKNFCHTPQSRIIPEVLRFLIPTPSRSRTRRFKRV